MIPPLIRRGVVALGPFLVLFALLIVLRIAVGPTFWSWGNLQNICTQTVIVAVGAIGMTVIIVGGGIDLSCGACVALSAVFSARVLASAVELGDQPTAHERWWHWLAVIPDYAAVPVAILVGLAVGLANGAIIAGLRQVPFITTLGMMGIARGMAKWQADNNAVNFEVPWLSGLLNNPRPPGPDSSVWSWIRLAPSVWITLGLAVAMSVMMRFTVLGRNIHAIGSNEAAARLCGIRLGPHKLAIYAIGGACFGLAGLFSAARLTQGDPTAGLGMELDIIAAVVVGGASLTGGVGTISGSIAGALMMTVLRNGSQQLGWESYIQEILIGGSIILAVALDRLRARKG